jgi:acyl carrier protein
MGANDGEGRRVDGVIYYVRTTFLSNFPGSPKIIRIGPETKLREDLGFDEKQIRKIANTLEEAFHAKIPDEKLKNITTVQELSDLTELFEVI